MLTLIGEHPAAIRLVAWQFEAWSAGQPAHLEIETKQGHVALIDHRTGDVYRRPARPADVLPLSSRHWHDLTETLTCAFDERPVFTAIVPLREAATVSVAVVPSSSAVPEGGVVTGWRFEFSNGGSFEFHLHPSHPVLSAQQFHRLLQQ